MDKIINFLNELHNINSAYSLSNDTIDKLLAEIETAKVCTPVIGKFSAGKSALINTLLGYSRKLLKEDITPETAVPYEITYSPDEDNVCIYNIGDTHQNILVSEFRELETNADSIQKIRLNLKNSFLEEIPDVMLVDMPGFESGYEVHNKAIDNYLPLSLAYIIVFPADDMILRSSIGNILKELCLHDMPICVAITKYDKRDDAFEDTFENLQESLKRYIGNREVTYCITSSLNGDAEELEDFLRTIQERSQEILKKRFKNGAVAAANITSSYLKTTLKSSEMSESELDEQEERIGEQLNTLNDRFGKEKESFDKQIADCVEEIKSDILIALESEESTFIAMAMNNQNINDRINKVVRNAVTTSVKKNFIPKVEKYLKKVTDCINGDSIGDIHIAFSFNGEEINKGITGVVVAAAAGILIAGPIGGIISAIICAVTNKNKAEKKREEAKLNIRNKLRSDVYPQVLKEVGTSMEIEITKQLKIINTSIEDEINSQRTTLEKALEDVRQKISDEHSRKENLEIDLKSDLERIHSMNNDL